jgi:hypothetical protein
MCTSVVSSPAVSPSQPLLFATDRCLRRSVPSAAVARHPCAASGSGRRHVHVGSPCHKADSSRPAPACGDGSRCQLKADRQHALTVLLRGRDLQQEHALAFCRYVVADAQVGFISPSGMVRSSPGSTTRRSWSSASLTKQSQPGSRSTSWKASQFVSLTRRRQLPTASSSGTRRAWTWRSKP